MLFETDMIESATDMESREVVHFNNEPVGDNNRLGQTFDESTSAFVGVTINTGEEGTKNTADFMGEEQNASRECKDSKECGLSRN
jgi:hypothetical protein